MTSMSTRYKDVLQDYSRILKLDILAREFVLENSVQESDFRQNRGSLAEQDLGTTVDARVVESSRPLTRCFVPTKLLRILYEFNLA